MKKKRDLGVKQQPNHNWEGDAGRRRHRRRVFYLILVVVALHFIIFIYY